MEFAAAGLFPGMEEVHSSSARAIWMEVDQCSFRPHSERAEQDDMIQSHPTVTDLATGIVNHVSSHEDVLALNPIVDQEPPKELYPWWSVAVPDKSGITLVPRCSVN